MTFGTLIRRSLRFHWRSHLGVVLGAAVGSAALIGALVVGDSVKGSLREQALARVGEVWAALDSQDRLFTTNLVPRMVTAIQDGYNATVAYSTETGFDPEFNKSLPMAGAALRLSTTLSMLDGSRRANGVSAIGGRPTFLALVVPDGMNTNVEHGTVWLNTSAAKQLEAKLGDEVVLRIPKPSALAADAAISRREAGGIALRLRVGRILAPNEGNFLFRSGSQGAINAFVNREELLGQLGLEPVANVLITSYGFHWRSPPSWMRFRNAFQDWRKGFRRNPFTNLEWIRSSEGRVRANSLDSATGANRLISAAWTLADIQCSLGAVASKPEAIELRTTRIFLDPTLSSAAITCVSNKLTIPHPLVYFLHSDRWLTEVNPVFDHPQPILTYLATLLRAGTNATPYSMVTAAGAPWTPADLRDDEIVVSQWLAEDLQVKPGNEIALSYFLPESGAKLTEATNSFRVRSIVPPEMPWADRALMPDFPGIEKAESTSEWDAGFPLTYKVRTKDDEYWKKYRGTPKAFITLAAGQKIWGNRFGNLTAIRFPIPTNAPSPLTPALSPSAGARENRPQSQSKPMAADGSARVEKSTEGQQLSPLPFGRGEGQGEGTSAEVYRAALEKKILTNLKPEELGLRFEPVREQALKAAEQSQDFGGLFLGFSFFVIGAALLLVALLFSLGLEQRAPEIGTLLALGFTPKQVRKLLLREAMALSLIGGVIGAVGGIYYAKGMLHGLTTIWRDAVGATTLNFHVTGQTLVIGVFASVVVSVVTIWLTLRKFVRRPARELLAGETQDETAKGRSWGNLIGAAALVCAVGTVGWTLWSGETNNAESFFSAGSLVLVAGLSFVSAWLARRTGVAPVSILKSSSNGDRRDACPTLASLAVSGCARRRKRSLSTVAMLACGSFLIVSIGVFRLDADRDATKRSSGTGGFALMGETTMPVVQDLNSKSGRDAFALEEKELAGVGFVPFRVRAGDEASCLNLNAAQRPRLLGVKPEMLDGRFAFAKGDGWAALRAIANGQSPMAIAEQSKIQNPKSKIEIPAIGDANSIQWAMHKKVGDTIDYVDERGQPFKVRIVGAVANSILQGQLIIDEADFVNRFPSESGYRMFLMDAPSNAVSQVSATLSRAMQDVGLELTPAAHRLDQFNAVQNTYLGTFQVLGGLGLLLGSVGLGIVVLRNVLERRGELAVLMAVGFRRSQLQRLLLVENGALLAAGLALGVIAAAVAVLPALLSPGAQLPYASLALTLGAVLVNGALWTWAATRWAVRGDLLKALRNE